MLAAGLDACYHWSAGFWLPAELLGLSLILTGYVITSYAYIENAFFSGTVRIQGERGHKVVSSGPYAWVHHPDCRGSLVASLEDRFLQKNLPGYRSTRTRVASGCCRTSGEVLTPAHLRAIILPV